MAQQAAAPGAESSSGVTATTLQSLLAKPLAEASAEIVKLAPAAAERLRSTLWGILGTVSRKDEFLGLQRVLASKQDLTLEGLSAVPLPLGKILVAVRTGIQAFLHPSVQMSEQHLAEIFLQRRCKNMACQSPLPANDCTCHMCNVRPGPGSSGRGGFCNLCMCVMCKKFDFETNTCRWIGCDFCLHWCHADCAIQMGHIRSVNGAAARQPLGRPWSSSRELQPVAAAAGGEDTAFCCPSCGHCSDLIGFVKDVFGMCSEHWDAKGTRNELMCVRSMFAASSNSRAQELVRAVSRGLAELDQGTDFRAVREQVRSFLCHDLVKGVPAGSAAGASEHYGAYSKGPSAEGEAGRDGVALGYRGGEELSRKRPAEGGLEGKEHVGPDVIFLDEEGAKDALADCNRLLEEKRKELVVVNEEKLKRQLAISELQSVKSAREADVKRLEAEAEEARKEVRLLDNIIQVKQRTSEHEFEVKKSALMIEEIERKRRRILETLESMVWKQQQQHEQQASLPPPA